MTKTAKVYFDGASRGNPGPSAVGYSIEDNGTEVDYGSKRIKDGTNNEAEWKALIIGLKSASKKGFSKVVAIGDSELIVRQMLGEYRVNAENLQPLYREALEVVDSFDEFSIKHVSRNGNARADKLANRAIDG